MTRFQTTKMSFAPTSASVNRARLQRFCLRGVVPTCRLDSHRFPRVVTAPVHRFGPGLPLVMPTTKLSPRVHESETTRLI
jgi:hypothetical protein